MAGKKPNINENFITYMRIADLRGVISDIESCNKQIMSKVGAENKEYFALALILDNLINVLSRMYDITIDLDNQTIDATTQNLVELVAKIISIHQALDIYSDSDATVNAQLTRVLQSMSVLYPVFIIGELMVAEDLDNNLV